MSSESKKSGKVKETAALKTTVSSASKSYDEIKKEKKAALKAKFFKQFMDEFGSATDKEHLQRHIDVAVDVWDRAETDRLDKDDSIEILSKTFEEYRKQNNKGESKESKRDIVPTKEQFAKLWDSIDLKDTYEDENAGKKEDNQDKGLSLRGLIFIFLGIGDPNSFEPDKEPHPSDSLNLIFEALDKSDYLQKADFAATALLSKKDCLRRAIATGKPVYSLGCGRERMQGGKRVTSRLNLVVTACAGERHGDNSYPLIGVDEEGQTGFLKIDISCFPNIIEPCADLGHLEEMTQAILKDQRRYGWPGITLERRLEEKGSTAPRRVEKIQQENKNRQLGVREPYALSPDGFFSALKSKRVESKAAEAKSSPASTAQTADPSISPGDNEFSH